MPNENTWKPLYLNINDPSLKNHFNNCEKCLDNKLFSYRFKRIIGKHYNTCNCITCYLNNTLSSQPFIETLEKISGLKALVTNEINISYYSKDDFINIHADQNKGDFAITLSFKIIDDKSKHFVSKVNVDKNRYVISAWYYSLYK